MLVGFEVEPVTVRPQEFHQPGELDIEFERHVLALGSHPGDPVDVPAVRPRCRPDDVEVDVATTLTEALKNGERLVDSLVRGDPPDDDDTGLPIGPGMATVDRIDRGVNDVGMDVINSIHDVSSPPGVREQRRVPEVRSTGSREGAP